MPRRYQLYDTADYLKTPEDVADYLNLVLEEGDEKQFLRALGNAVRATKNMTEAAREIGLSREALYTTLSEKGNPKLSSLLSVLHSMGLEFSVRPSSKAI